MQKLVKGIHHFQDQIFSSKREMFERLHHGQQPDALFITCADSRINPNLITHTEPGELFILRNAGNIVPPHGAGTCGEAATIEYAVAVLGVRDIIVCGHSQCGAMHALLAPEKVADLPSVSGWLSHAEATRNILKENYAHLDDEAKANVAIQENVLVQLENLKTLPSVASALARGAINLHGWVYKIQTGEVFAFDPEKGQFTPILQEDEARPAYTNPRLNALQSI